MPSSRQQRHYYRDSEPLVERPRRASGADYRRHNDRGSRRHSDDHTDESETRRHRRGYSRSRSSRSRQESRGRDNFVAKSKTTQALTAAVTAGAVEAIKLRREPGKWMGEKGVRVASAALSAAAVDAAVTKDPGDKPKRHVAEATAAGIAINHLLKEGSKKL